MKICKNCKTEVDDANKFCTGCGGTEFEKCQLGNKEATVTQPETDPTVNFKSEQISYPQPQVQSQDNQKVNVWLVVLSVFLPIFGIIYYFVKKKENYKEAKACGLASLIVIIVNVVLSLIIWIATFAGLGAFVSNLDSTNSGSTYEYEYEYDNLDDFSNENQSDADTVKDDTETSKNEVTTSVKDNSSTNFKQYEIVFNGTKVKLPCSYAEFSKATGYKFEEDDGAQTLKNNYTTSECLISGEKRIYCSFFNDSGEMSTLSQCSIAGVSVYDESDLSTITFPGNLKVGDTATVENITDMFGNPDYSYDNGEYHSLQYDDESNNYNGFKIVIDDGVIYSLSLNNYVK